MSVREDRERNCPSRGLGIAAAAIGVGVGAAIYYFFNKRSEQPDSSGSTSNWTNNNNSFEEHQVFRERSWTLEECSICFDSMQRDQEVLALTCAHRFHQDCIIPWLQQRSTCPNCRKET